MRAEDVGELEDQLERDGPGAKHDEGAKGTAVRETSRLDHAQQRHPIANAKVCQIPLSRIRISAESRVLQAKLKPVSELMLDDEFKRLGVQVHPPVVVADPDHPGGYLTVDDGLVVQWLADQLEGDEAKEFKLPVLVIDAPSVARGVVAATRGLLMPLVLGQLSTRADRTARKQLREAGIPPPRKRSRRKQLVRLANR